MVALPQHAILRPAVVAQNFMEFQEAQGMCSGLESDGIPRVLPNEEV